MAIKRSRVAIIKEVLFDLLPPLFLLSPLSKDDPEIPQRFYRFELVPLTVDKKKFEKHFGIFSKIIGQKVNNNNSDILVLFKSEENDKKEVKKWVPINDLIFKD